MIEIDGQAGGALDQHRDLALERRAAVPGTVWASTPVRAIGHFRRFHVTLGTLPLTHVVTSRPQTIRAAVRTAQVPTEHPGQDRIQVRERLARAGRAILVAPALGASGRFV